LGALSLILLLSGGLKALQTASIVAALPFTVVMSAMMVSLVKGLRQDLKEGKYRYQGKRSKT